MATEIFSNDIAHDSQLHWKYEKGRHYFLDDMTPFRSKELSSKERKGIRLEISNGIIGEYGKTIPRTNVGYIFFIPWKLFFFDHMAPTFLKKRSLYFMLKMDHSCFEKLWSHMIMKCLWTLYSRIVLFVAARLSYKKQSFRAQYSTTLLV